MIACPSPEQLVWSLRKVLPIIREAHRISGHEVNFAAGKTETVVKLRGATASAAWRNSFDHDVDGQWLLRIPDRDLVCRIARQYKHLGTSFATSSVEGAEVALRCHAGIAHSALSKSI
eukprot:13159167-Alexandrium_andersonii.AAC.1